MDYWFPLLVLVTGFKKMVTMRRRKLSFKKLYKVESIILTLQKFMDLERLKSFGERFLRILDRLGKN